MNRHQPRPDVIKIIITVILYAIVFSSAQASATPIVTSSDHLQITSNVRLSTSDVAKTVTQHASGLVQCALECLNQPLCTSLSFNANTYVCHIHQLTMSSTGAVVVYDTNYRYAEINSRIEWHLAFRATQGIGISVYGTWNNIGHHDDVTSVTSNTIGCLTVDGRLPCDKHLRTRRLDDWANVALVKHAFYTDSQEVFYVTFNASGTTSSNRDDHFRLSNVVASSASELVGYTGVSNYNSIEGHALVLRHFYLQQAYNGCFNDPGWMLVNDGYNPIGGCHYETDAPYPNFYYTDTNTVRFWGQAGIPKVQVFAVFLKYRD